MISRLITSLFANVIAFLAAAYFLPGFTVSGDPVSFIILVGIFTLINFIIYPIIRLVLTPLVVITFGLFTIIIHAGILYIVDLYSDHITIDGLLNPPLCHGYHCCH